MTNSSSIFKEIIQGFHKMKGLGDKTMEQLSFEELTFQLDKEDNSIAIIVKHMWGNMLSRWTHFLTEDGEKTFRDRDNEFVDNLNSKEEIIQLWEEGWQCLFDALNEINEENISSTVYIRKEAHTVTQAVLRQYSHYSYHIGQMVQLGKHIKQENWKSLSIPKGKSNDFKDSAGEYKYNQR